jgi:AcrR family transcriptional regulator
VSDTLATGTRDRLLLAAAQLLVESGDRTASTRAICDRAGVTAPTLYHHFGSKQGLIDAVLNHGFTQYVGADGDAVESADPLADVRAGWDRHVQFGLEHPTFYALLYGAVEPGRPCVVTAPAQARLLALFAIAARRGLLRVPPADAAAQLLAANVGVTLSLIPQPDAGRDPGLSHQVREAILAAITHSGPRPAGGRGRPPARASAAIALRSLLDQDAGDLSAGEALLLDELLQRLGRSRSTVD